MAIYIGCSCCLSVRHTAKRRVAFCRGSTTQISVCKRASKGTTNLKPAFMSVLYYEIELTVTSKITEMNRGRKMCLSAFQLHSCVTTVTVMQLFLAPAWWYNFHSLLGEARRGKHRPRTLFLIIWLSTPERHWGQLLSSELGRAKGGSRTRSLKHRGCVLSYYHSHGEELLLSFQWAFHRLSHTLIANNHQ